MRISQYVIERNINNYEIFTSFFSRIKALFGLQTSYMDLHCDFCQYWGLYILLLLINLVKVTLN